jgi:hypothetical protein
LAIFFVFGALGALVAAFGALVAFLAAFLATLAGDLAGDEAATGAGVVATGAGVVATGAVLVTFVLAATLAFPALGVFGLLFEAVLFDCDLFCDLAICVFYYYKMDKEYSIIYNPYKNIIKSDWFILM